MAQGTQNLFINDNAREQTRFEEGAKQAFQAVVDIYKMDDKTRHILFGNKGIMILLNEDPLKILDILKHADEILANHVEVGDVIAKDDDETFRDVVTFVYETGNFDAIGISDKRHGRVTKCMNMHDNHYHKTGEHIENYFFKQYTWE